MSGFVRPRTVARGNGLVPAQVGAHYGNMLLNHFSKVSHDTVTDDFLVTQCISGSNTIAAPWPLHFPSLQ